MEWKMASYGTKNQAGVDRERFRYVVNINVYVDSDLFIIDTHHRE